MHVVVYAAAIEQSSEPALQNFSRPFFLPARDRRGKPVGLTLSLGPWPHDAQGTPRFPDAKDRSLSHRLGDFQLCVSNQ